MQITQIYTSLTHSGFFAVTDNGSWYRFDAPVFDQYSKGSLSPIGREWAIRARETNDLRPAFCGDILLHQLNRILNAEPSAAITED
jgi:hypothetical protein